MNSRSGGVVVSIEFTIPVDVPPGEYWINVCNNPCTTGLGDLIGGVIYIGMDPPIIEEDSAPIAVATATGTAPEPPGAIAQPAQQAASLRLALAPAPRRPASLSPIWVGISAALGGAVLLGALLSRQRG